MSAELIVILVVLALVAGCVGYLVSRHQFSANPSTDLANLRADALAELAAIKASVAGLFSHVTATHATPVSVKPSVALAQSAPAATPVAAPPVPPATTNGVATPPDMTDAAFTSLVVAVQGAKSLLATPGIDLTTQSAAWFAGLGPYFREALLRYATGPVLAALTALPQPNPLTVSAMDWTCAEAAVNAVAPPKA